MSTNSPAEVFPVRDFIREEMDARGWTMDDLLDRMPGERRLNEIWMELIMQGPEMEVDDPSLRGTMSIGDCSPLAHAFGTSKEFWENLNRAWIEHQRRNRP